jgi:hypothetical protein
MDSPVKLDEFQASEQKPVGGHEEDWTDSM